MLRVYLNEFLYFPTFEKIEIYKCYRDRGTTAKVHKNLLPKIFMHQCIDRITAK